MKDFRQLKVWGKAHSLTLKIYELSNHFPNEKTCGITNQIRRACASIPTNIAEGCGRNGDAELSRFFSIASGSASEIEYLFQLIFDLKYIEKSKYDELSNDVTEIKKMLTVFIQKLKADSYKTERNSLWIYTRM